MSPVAAVHAVLRQYAGFTGRATRPEFWWWQLATIVATLISDALDRIAEAAVGFSFVGVAVSLGLALPTLAVSVRRLHDSGLTGWWLLAPVGLSAAGAVMFVIGLIVSVGPVFFDSGSTGAVPVTIGMAICALGIVLALASIVLNIVLMVRRSTPGPNRFGTHPSQPAPVVW